MTWLNRIGGAVKSAFERDDIGMAGMVREEPVMYGDTLRPTTSRYAAIKDAVERRVATFLRQDLVSHLEIGFNEIFVLHYIEISADNQGKPALLQFLHEFSPEARIDWVKKLLGPAVGQHVNIDQFMGLDQEFSAEDLAETDPFEEELNHVARPTYRIVLHGRWDSRPAPMSSGSIAAVEPVIAEPPLRAPGPKLVIAIQDAKWDASARDDGAARSVEFDQFPAVLGSSAQADIEVSGYYVSAMHCTLYWNEGKVWLEDHSTNGTWVDGEKLRRGTRVSLANGSVLGIGRARSERDYERYPAIRIQRMGAGSARRQPHAGGAAGRADDDGRTDSGAHRARRRHAHRRSRADAGIAARSTGDFRCHWHAQVRCAQTAV
jgi:hypothetical protein